MARLEARRQRQHDTPPQPRIDPRSAAGDEKRLRYIPAIGRNAPGAIPGTRPGERIRGRP